MRFVVTGAGGFLGSHLVHYLLTKTAHDVIAVSSQEPSSVIEKARTVDDAVIPVGERLRVESNDALLQRALLQEGDVVVSCAFPWNRSGLEMASGLTFQRDLFRIARDRQVKTFINISSQSVYDDNRDYPASESSPLDLSSPYSVAKYSMELLGSEILSRGQLVNVRMGSLIGRGYDKRIVNRFLARGLRGMDLEIQDGGVRYAYLDVRDAVRALVAVGEQGAMSSGFVLNIGTAVSVPLVEIAEMSAAAVMRLTGDEIRLVVERSDGVTENVTRYALDCRLVQEKYDFKAQYSPEESVAHIAEALSGVIPHSNTVGA